MTFRIGFPLTMALAALGLPAQFPAQSDDPPPLYETKYTEAKDDVALFNPEELTLGQLQKRVLLDGLVAAAVNSTGASHERRSKALALALQVDPEHQDAVAANALFVEKRRPKERVKGFRTTTEVGELLWLAAVRLDAGSEADRVLGRYVKDIVRLCGPSDKNVVTALKEAQEGPDWPNWENVFPPPPKPQRDVEREELEAAVFAAEKTEANALLLGRVGNRFTGKSSTIYVKAEREEPITRKSYIRYEVGAFTRIGSEAWRASEEMIPERAGELWRRGYKVEVSLEGDYAKLDLQSASVAAALALEMLTTGEAYDPKFAVSGYLRESGNITRVGAISHKIAGAVEAGLTHIAVPKENSIDLMDHYVMSAPELLRVQVFAVENYDEVKTIALAPEHRDFLVNESLRIFGETAAKIARSGSPADAVRHPEAVAALRKVLELTPNHWSARMMLAQASGKAPTALSIGRSFFELETLADAADHEREITDAVMNRLTKAIRERARYDPAMAPLIKAFQAVHAAEQERRQVSSTRLDGKTWEDLRREAQAELARALDDLENNPGLKAALEIMRDEPLDENGAER